MSKTEDMRLFISQIHPPTERKDKAEYVQAIIKVFDCSKNHVYKVIQDTEPDHKHGLFKKFYVNLANTTGFADDPQIMDRIDREEQGHPRYLESDEEERFLGHMMDYYYHCAPSSTKQLLETITNDSKRFGIHREAVKNLYERFLERYDADKARPLITGMKNDNSKIEKNEYWEIIKNTCIDLDCTLYELMEVIKTIQEKCKEYERQNNNGENIQDTNIIKTES